MKPRWLILTLLAACTGNEAAEKWRYERVVWEDRPETKSAADATTTADRIASKKSLTLDDCYRLALRQSETLAISGEELAVLEALYDQGIAAILPSIKFKGSYTRQDKPDSGESAFTLSERREYKFTLHQPIFSGLREFAALRQTGSLQEAATSDLRRAKLLLFSDVAQAFYAIRLASRDLATTEDSLRLARERLEELVQRNKAGIARRSEVLAQEAEVATTEAGVTALRGNLEIAWSAFQFVTGLRGRPALDDTLPDPAALPPFETLVRRAYASRDDLLSLDRQIAAGEDGVRGAQGAYLPTLSLDANYYTFREGVSEEIDWDVLLSLEVPLFDGFSTLAKIREAESAVRVTRLLRERLVRSIAVDLHRAYTQTKSLESQRKSLEKAVASASENYDIVRAEYRQGIVTNIEVLQSLNVLLRSRLEFERADVQHRLAAVGVWVAAGTLPEGMK